MNRLTIVTDAWQAINGVVTTYENCVREAEKEGWQVTVIHPNNFFNFKAPGYDDVVISFPWRLGKLIEKSDPDHIHIAVEGPLGWTARLWCKRNNRAYTTAYHTKWPDYMKHLFHIPPVITKKVLRWFHCCGTSVLTTTETMARELREDNITDKAVAWTRGVNEESFSDPRTVKIYRPSAKIHCVSVGRVSKEKNLDVFCSLDPKEYDLTVVGDGPYRKELEEKYPNVKFVGMKKGTELASMYRDADVMVFTSLTDTFGLVMIESMYMGTPVAAFPVTGPIDVIDSCITGRMNNNLEVAIELAYNVDRKKCAEFARSKWTWNNAWHIMRDNLV